MYPNAASQDATPNEQPLLMKYSLAYLKASFALETSFCM